MAKYEGVFRIVKRTDYAGHSIFVVQTSETWPWKDISEHGEIEDAIHAADGDYTYYLRTHFHPDEIVVE